MIIDREMGRHRLLGARDAPALAFAANRNNPYFYFVYGLLGVTLPIWIGLEQNSLELFWWLFAVFGSLGLVLIYLAAVRVRRWHRARAAVRAYLAEQGGSFPDELRWYS